MSHANGKVLFEDGTIMFYEYNGTCDFTCTALRHTNEEVQEHWRADNKAECTCGQPSEKVRLMTDYGFGYSWDGKACRQCMAITGGIELSYEMKERGIPEWAKKETTAMRRPHINIGTLGMCTMPSLTASLLAAPEPHPEAVVSDQDDSLAVSIPAQEYEEPAPVIVDDRPRFPVNAFMYLPALAMGGGMMSIPGFSARNPSQQERNNPHREKTRADLERLEKARLKRERKAARR